MTSPKLNLLERKMNRGAIPSTPPDSATSKMMLSYQAECDSKAQLAVKAVETKLTAAEAEIASLKEQLAAASRDNTHKQKLLTHQIDDVKDVGRQAMDNLKASHSQEIAAMAGTIESLRRECTKECEGKIRAEAERDSAVNACKKMEQMVTKLQEAKPVVAAPPPPKPKPLLEFKVTARDENGRIVSFKQIS